MTGPACYDDIPPDTPQNPRGEGATAIKHRGVINIRRDDRPLFSALHYVTRAVNGKWPPEARLVEITQWILWPAAVPDLSSVFTIG